MENQITYVLTYKWERNDENTWTHRREPQTQNANIYIYRKEESKRHWGLLEGRGWVEGEDQEK